MRRAARTRFSASERAAQNTWNLLVLRKRKAGRKPALRPRNVCRAVTGASKDVTITARAIATVIQVVAGGASKPVASPATTQVTAATPEMVVAIPKMLTAIPKMASD